LYTLTEPAAQTRSYQLDSLYSGETFFDGWNFNTVRYSDIPIKNSAVNYYLGK